MKTALRARPAPFLRASAPLAVPALWPIVLPALLASCAPSSVAHAPGGAALHGTVLGGAAAKVCLDLNANARCDAGEPATLADANGTFTLPQAGAVVAEIAAPPSMASAATDSRGARPRSTSSASTPAAAVTALRAPAGAAAVVSPVSTELVALMEADRSPLPAAVAKLAARLGVAQAELLEAPDRIASARARSALQAENAQLLPSLAAAATEAGTAGDRARVLRNHLALDAIETVVVIYAENRAFDTLYGFFPGANGIPGRNPSAVGRVLPQRDFDGSELPVLPPAWGGLTAGGQSVVLTQAQSTGMPNAPFQIDDPKGLNGTGIVVPPSVITRDLVHRFYSNIMQIAGGRNDRFAAYSDAGALSMGYYDGSTMQLWKIARQYTLADNFFMGAFGGSFLNHQYLVCGCAPTYPNADAPDSPAKDLVSQIEVDAQGRFVRLVPAATMPATVLAGAPRHKRDGTLTPKDESGMFFAINTMQPPYQPSGNMPAESGDKRYADRTKATTLPPQTQTTIGDTLSAKGVGWAWYGGSWAAASADTPEGRKLIYGGLAQFQSHHQPFNYYARFDPATQRAERDAHLKDFDASFIADARAGTLPPVTFYKPQGNLNQHAGYASVAAGDAHIAEVIQRLQASPQWPHMLIVVTYDENGGFYDHAPVPIGDRFGPGTRVPAIIVSPYARKGFVDKTPYDTGSILRFITRRWSLAPLPGIAMRDQALQKNGEAPMGDLSNALDLDALVNRRDR